MIITYKTEVLDKITEEDLVKKILDQRKIEDTKSYYNPPSPLTISIRDFGHDYETEIKKTIEVLEDCKKNNKTIVVYTDYDADGITGGTILWETLHLLGFKVMPYVPHRKHEGYGFSIKGIDKVKELYNPALIISVDHGIAAAEKISYAKSIGIPIIVTDHHLKQDVLPDDAVAIFHIPQLSGSGVSYFFSKEVYLHFTKNYALPKASLLEEHFKTDYLSLASIGTIADLVPLVGPSRSIAKYGLEAFPKVTRKGLQCIMEESGIADKKITPYEVGFIIAPRINAVGRLEHAINALRLLCTTSEEKAQELASGVGKTNQERQDLVKVAVEQAKEMVRQQNGTQNKILILHSKDWHEGIIGLIASKLVEEFYRPAIVMTEVDGFLKGSARSIPTFHITDFLRSLKEHLVDAGGHKQAAGFTIETPKLSLFIEKAIEKANSEIKDEDLVRKMETDVKLPLSFITKHLAKIIEQMQPFGIGNPQPVFYSMVKVREAQIFGKKNEHLRIRVSDPNSEMLPLELIAFSKAADFHSLSRDQEIELVYQIEINRWNGTERLQGKLIYWQ